MSWIRLLAAGAAIAALIYSGGYYIETYERSRLPALMKKCTIARSATESWEPPEVAAERCNATLLAKLEPDKLSSVQREIVDSHFRVHQVASLRLPVAIIVFVILALPFTWYFLLDRVRELRQAALGK